ncbi:PH domain-containing protein [Bacillus sp. JCM 19041]|uniref:PH domain-containing protein n=1 Tax=Bacillus sp. JCM 19041 TaxID=1460637 RepID=UPI00336A96C0
MTAIEPMGSPFSGNERILGSSQGFTIKHTGPKGEVKISPERMEEFKLELIKRAPQVKIRTGGENRNER